MAVFFVLFTCPCLRIVGGSLTFYFLFHCLVVCLLRFLMQEADSSVSPGSHNGSLRPVVSGTLYI